MVNKVLFGDCLEIMTLIADHCVDMICCDLPYEVTANKKDISIPPELLWPLYWRILKPNGVIVLFGQDKFTAKMMLSDPNHRYNLIWNKKLTTGFLNANKQPLRVHEDIMVFYKQQPTYNPQKTKGRANHTKGNKTKFANNNYGEHKVVDNFTSLGDMKHPTSILSFQKPHPSKCIHRTQKPVPLIEYLIKTFTNEEDIVLDNCSGSGTTAIACMKSNRNYICIENDIECFRRGNERISEYAMEKYLF